MSLTVLPSNGSGDYNITDSLRFRSDANASLYRDLTVSSNRKTWTWSGWHKRGKIDKLQILFGARNDGGGSDFTLLYFTSDARLIWNTASSGWLQSNAVYRDASAWYHIVLSVDTTQATDTDRVKIWVNGELITFDPASTGTYPTQNTDTHINNSAVTQRLGIQYLNISVDQWLDGYLAEVNFVDGQALTPSDFGEYNPITGVWSPKEYTGTYGTNGFYLPMKETTQVTGFNTLTYQGNGTSQVLDTGFVNYTDLIWIKDRDNVSNHILANPQIGHSKYLSSNTTTGDTTDATTITGFNKGTNSLGVGLGSSSLVNGSGRNYVAWCWGGDAGTSAVSNTDGTITSTVRANPATGFSTVRYTGNGTAGATIGHGLGSAPEMIIIKNRDSADPWTVYHASLGATKGTYLNLTDAPYTLSVYWNDTVPDANKFTLGSYSGVNGSSNNIIAFCFSEVAGFSKFGSYTGNGVAGTNTVTTGFRPAFVMIKRTDSTSNWTILDNTRDVDSDIDKKLYANTSDAENASASSNGFIPETNGFTLDSTFADTNASGGTYIYIAFADTRDFQWNFDASGNKNNWTPVNINSNASSETTYDLMSDVPSLADEDTGNFATLNPLVIGDGGTMSDGNLTFTTPTATRGFHAGTIGMTSGKWYWEVTCSASTYNTTNRAAIGYKLGNERSSYVISGTDGDVGNMGFYTGDTVGFAFDADNGTLENFLNGVSNATVSSIDMTKTWFPIGADAHTAQNGTVHWNFGQRPFKYTPPTGYKKLNTYNLLDSSITDGSKYMNVKLWTGNGTNQDVDVGWNPDLVWHRNRTDASGGVVTDSIRGDDLHLQTTNTNAEGAFANFEFITDGYNVAGNANLDNQSGKAFVGWNWRGSDSAPVTNTNGDITTTVSANPTSGFSVATFTGNGLIAQTIGHGLSQPTELHIWKRRDAASDWGVSTTVIDGSVDYLRLNSIAAKVDSGTAGQYLPTSTTQYISFTGAGLNDSGGEYVCYSFHSVEGFSKFGSFVGNGSADGPFVYTGFKPTFVMLKNANDTRNWLIMDTARSTYNQTDHTLEANVTNAENPYDDMDILSNGFKMRTTDPGGNGNGNTIIYMAFAENPFKNSLAR